MANTLNDLYLKYVNKVGATVEKDRYFQYLFAMTQAGQNVLQQKNKILHKTVDEEWLTTIEQSLDSINAVIANPRRFVATSEEVVPVALAKKITADSVRHLSQNTQFIASNEDGNVQPTRILNVTTEDSYDLYENRFVYHLIQRLVAFIDKRTDLIFWSTGDETMNTLCMESKIDDAYETIEYKMEMKIKNRQSFAENDSENMQVFMRIDRVRRMVMSLRNSSFCSLMAGCAKVRSPIQRTNLMMKDPDYRNCYRLWHFLENYDSIGYTIEEQDRPLEFDEEYLIQLQSNLIANYTIFKSILEKDARNLTEIPPKRRRVIRPRFLKKIDEQIVNDYDIEDVEVRKVIIEEVTQAQLDAEAKLTEETRRADEAEAACEEAERNAAEAYTRMQNAIQDLAAAEETARLAVTAREEAETALARNVRSSQESIQAAEKARLAAEKRAEECLDAKRDMEVVLREEQAARKQAEEDCKQAKEERTVAEKQMLADRIAREKAQAAELRAVKGRKKAEEQIKKSAEKAEKYKETFEAERTARNEAEKIRRQSEKMALTAEEARVKAVDLRMQADEKTRESAKAAREAEKARAAAERRMQAALEGAAQARQERKEAIARSLADRRALEKTQKAMDAALEAKEKELQSQIEKGEKAQQRADKALQSAQAARDREEKARLKAEVMLAKLQEELEAEKAARMAAEQRADENSISRRILSALSGGRKN